MIKQYKKWIKKNIQNNKIYRLQIKKLKDAKRNRA